MAINFSKKQQEVIDSRDKNLLVSAAAGSGKTAVLIQRIISLITDKDKPVDLDRFLVLTFTEAAAGEMKERLSKALEGMIETDPDNEYLQKQAVLIHHAQINTIHSFCSYIIRNYFYKEDMDPNFRVMEEGEVSLLVKDVMGEFLEEMYAKGSPDFVDFTNRYFTKRDDDKLEDLVYKLYLTANKSPWPNEWFAWALDMYSEKSISNMDEEEARDAKATAPYVKVLCDLAMEFGERFAREKEEKSLCTFDDLEHKALKILYKVDENGNRTYSDAANELSDHFVYIMTDEYQDSNLIQESILDAVSRNHKGEFNRFMVGDVKQSIYAFRQADPKLFMEKFDEYREENEEHKRIDLLSNYRSRKEVIDSVNIIFKKIMTSELGGIDYNEEAQLNFDASYKEEETPVDRHTEFVLMDMKSPDMEEYSKAGEALEIEAELVAQRIMETVGKLPVYDKDLDEYRPCRFSDITILLRSISNGIGDTFTSVLKSYGIPNFCVSKEGYFAATEIKTVLNYLAILDNPRQDIPFGAVMFSPIGKFTAQEMAIIRKGNQDSDYYDAVLDYCENGEDEELKLKLNTFMSQYKKLRNMVAYTPVHELIEELYQATDYRNFAASMPAGEQRAANLDMLIIKAENFENTSYHGLFNFIRYIEKMEKYSVDEGEVNISAENADTVKIMTIHKSKGLEFPVVFLCGTQKSFNISDTYGQFLFDPRFGIGIGKSSPKEHKYSKTAILNKIAESILEELMGENLRVLYVALTRAKEKLFITGIAKDYEKLAEEAKAFEDAEHIGKSVLLKHKSFLEWIFLGLYGSDDPSVKIHLETVHSLRDKIKKVETSKIDFFDRLDSFDKNAVYNQEIKDIIGESASFIYPYKNLVELPSKIAVTQLEHMLLEGREDRDFRDVTETPVVVPYLPEFAKKDEELTVTGAARGTAYHLVLEKLEYDKITEAENQCVDEDKTEAYLSYVNDLVSRLKEEGSLSEREVMSIDPKDIVTFIISPIGTRMKKAAMTGNLKREQPFTFTIPAVLVDETWPEDQNILVQGVIDAYFYEDGTYVIVDYKTDQTKDPTGAKLVDKHSNQLYYYQEALEAATGGKVSEKVLYSTCLGKEVRCP